MSSPVVARSRVGVPTGAEPARAASAERAAQRRRVYRRRRIVAGGVALTFLGLLSLGVLAVLSGFSKPDVQVVGLVKGNLIGGPAATDLLIRVPNGASKVVLDGVDARAASRVVGGRLEVRAGTVAEGRHRLSVDVRRTLRPDQHRTIRFTADLTPPALDVARIEPVVLPGGAKITGRTDKGATVTVDGRSVTASKEGFSLELAAPAPPSAVVTAVDLAGNRTETRVRITTVQPPVRAVHITELAWITPSLKDTAMGLLDDKKIDTIQLDLKDEGGEVGHRTEVAMAREVGAAKDRFTLAEAVKEIHDRGGRVIGRIVAYRDPKLADAAWEGDHRERVVQTPGGERYGAYGGGFLNPADPVVRQYTNDLATEAVKAGVDEILLDYVRRPDGALTGMRFPGVDGEGDAEEKAVEDVIVDHLAELHTLVRAGGGRLGASVCGIAATRPKEIAQDVPRMAEHLDYVAPMLYPSHWGKGEYGIADPNRAPGEIIRRSLGAFGQAVEGTGAGVVPWLQDFTLGVTYGEREVRAQIDAAMETGADGFLLWDAACTYTASALDAREAGKT